MTLGDRTNMLFQNTSVTRGTGSIVVTATGMGTEMGQIATMLTSVTRVRSPLQKELDSLTKILGVIAWTAVAFIVGVGLLRGLPFDDLSCSARRWRSPRSRRACRRSSPACWRWAPSSSPRRRAVVKNLTDVETLGSTSAINTDKTGTLTMNAMMVSTIYAGGSWFTVNGHGYEKTGSINSVAGAPEPDLTRLALGLVLDSDATVGDDGSVVGDPTEAALVVLAAKLGVSADETRRAYPRLAEVPFDSDYKFMATFHRVTVDGDEHVIELVKGGPDVVLDRCARAGGPLSDSQAPIDQARADADAANERMGEQGLRVLAFAARLVGEDELQTMTDEPMSLTTGLGVRRHGRDDRPAAPGGQGRGRDRASGRHRRPDDHGRQPRSRRTRSASRSGWARARSAAPTSRRCPTRRSCAACPSCTSSAACPRRTSCGSHGSCSSEGLIVAATGDAVNDAAALKQADIGVAMGSGSEVTKQAARMILTDDNFGTLVHAVELGRRVYDKVVSYVRYQMTQLLSLVMLFIAATAFDIADGVALTPLMVLYLLLFMTASGVVIIAIDPGDPDIMSRPPRDPNVPLTNHDAVRRWLLYGATLFIAALRAAGDRARHAEGRRAERVDDHDLRGDGLRHRVQRADQPARPRYGAWPADPHGARDRARSRWRCRPRNRVAGPAEGPADHRADRQAMVRLPRPGGAAAGRRRGEQVARADGGCRLAVTDVQRATWRAATGGAA